MLKSTLVGGIFVLVPLAVIAFVLGKVFQLANTVASPLGGLLPVDRVIGIAVADVLAVVLIVALCLFAGLAARMKFVADRVERLDDALADIVPRYAVAKSTLSGIADLEEAELSAILVRFDDCQQLAFEIERSGDRVAVFLPGSPSPWSGSCVVVDAARVSQLDLPTHQVVALLRVQGRGTFDALASGGGAAPAST